MTDEVEYRQGAPGDAMFDQCMVAMEAMRGATEFLAGQFEDPREAITCIMTAAAMFAGVQAGTLLAIGALRNQDKKRVGDAASTNFREGMKLGERRARRIDLETAGSALQ